MSAEPSRVFVGVDLGDPRCSLASVTLLEFGADGSTKVLAGQILYEEARRRLEAEIIRSFRLPPELLRPAAFIWPWRELSEGASGLVRELLLCMPEVSSAGAASSIRTTGAESYERS